MTRYDPLTDHPAHGHAAMTRNPWAAASNTADNPHAAGRRRRLIVSIVGIAGFLALLLGAHFAGDWQKPVRAAALIWFLVFGVLRFGMDVTQL